MSDFVQKFLPARANDNAFDIDALIASVIDAWFAPGGPLGDWTCDAASSRASLPSADTLTPPAPVGPMAEWFAPPAATLPEPFHFAQQALETPFNWADFQSGFTDLLDHVNQWTDALGSAVQNSHSGEEFAASICDFVRDWLSGQGKAGASFAPDEPITQTPDALGWLGGYDPHG